MIQVAPLKKLDLDPKVLRILNSLKPYSYFKGGVAREALIHHFTPDYMTRQHKPLMDLDFIVFGDDVELNDWGVDDVIFTAEQEDEYFRLNKLGDVETHWSIPEYFKTRDNTLNQVLLGTEGLYYTTKAKRSACSLSVDMADDIRPRTVLRNILFALRYGHTLPKADITIALKEAFVIDLLIPLLKAYRLGLEVEFYNTLARYSRPIRSHGDSDEYLVWLLKRFEIERGRPFKPRESADKRTVQKVFERVKYENF
jgi:hypothetical protein